MTKWNRTLFLLVAGAALCAAQPTPTLHISATALDFTAVAQGDAPPPQVVNIISSDGTPVTFAVRTDGGSVSVPAPAWLKLNVGTATTPARLRVFVDASGLAAGAQDSARIILTNPQGISLGPVISVTLAVAEGSPRLSVLPSVMRLSAARNGPRTLEQLLWIRNTGPGDIAPVTFQTVGPGNWLRVIPPTSCQRECWVTVMAFREERPAGLYQGSIKITTALGSRVVPVTMLIYEEAMPALALQPAAATFRARQGQGLTLTRDISILNAGGSVLQWGAEVVSGGEWLAVQNVSVPAGEGQPITISDPVELVEWLAVQNVYGTAEDGLPGTIRLRVDTAGLPVGVHHALIRVSSLQYGVPAQYLAATLEVKEAESLPAPILVPEGLVFTAVSGTGALPSTPVTVSTSSTEQVRYRASIATVNQVSWLSVSPTYGYTSTAQPAQALVSVSPASLPAGIYTGRVNFSLENLGVRSVNVTLVVHPASGCTAQRIGATHMTMMDGFSAGVSSAVPLTVRVVDDCGEPVTNGLVTVTFSNGDLPVPLSPTQDGYYSGAWSPLTPSPSVAVTATASASGLGNATAQVNGAVTAVANQGPVLPAGAAVNPFNRKLGAPVAPGEIVEIYGSGLATTTAAMSYVNGLLPTEFQGAKVIVGGLEAPLFYLSGGQVNAQIPYELAPNRRQQLMVSVAGRYSVPITIDVVTVQPGVAAFSNGMAIAFDEAGDMITESHRAQRGRVVTVYSVGMGPTTYPVPSGAKTPLPPPLRNAQNSAQATLGGKSAVVDFAGLSPLCTGLYQVNIRIPGDANSGNLPLIVTQDGIAANETWLPVQ